jgi:hypothetical protein
MEESRTVRRVKLAEAIERQRRTLAAMRLSSEKGPTEEIKNIPLNGYACWNRNSRNWKASTTSSTSSRFGMNFAAEIPKPRTRERPVCPQDQSGPTAKDRGLNFIQKKGREVIPALPI